MKKACTLKTTGVRTGLNGILRGKVQPAGWLREKKSENNNMIKGRRLSQVRKEKAVIKGKRLSERIEKNKLSGKRLSEVSPAGKLLSGDSLSTFWKKAILMLEKN